MAEVKFKPKFVRIQGLLASLMTLCSLEVDYKTILGLYVGFQFVYF